MKRYSPWLLVLGLALALMPLGCSKQPSDIVSPQTRHSTAARLLGTPSLDARVKDSYIVVFNDVVADVDREVGRISQRFVVVAEHRYQHALKGFSAKLPPPVVDALLADPSVAYIEHDQIATAIATQLNPTWGLDRVDQRLLPLDNSYTYNQTGSGVDAYILDTGIRLTHSDFGGRAVTGFDAITPGGTASDGHGHGTHVSGTVGGTTYGVAKSVRLIAVRVLDNTGSGTFAQVISGVDWVTGDHTTRPAVANMSLTGSVSAALDQAVRNSIADGVVYCVAAGNNGSNASNFSPAGVAEAVTVAASSITDGWASFSNFGAVVDIIAPGVSVTSDWNLSDTAINTISGTSMATPHVAGASALFLEANPGSTPAQVQSGLVAAATPNRITGVPAGTVNLLLFALIGTAPPGSPPPAPVLASPNDGQSTTRTPTLTWNASTGATSYRVQVSTDPGFASTAFDQSGITSTSITLPQLAARTTYFWHVNASNANGTSAFSSTRSFRTRNK